MEVCRLRDTPIMTFINKLDRDGRQPIELLDEIEKVLNIRTTPRHLADRHGARAARHLPICREIVFTPYEAGDKGRVGENRTIQGIASPEAREFLGDMAAAFDDEIELVKGPRLSHLTPRLIGPGASRRCFSDPPSITSGWKSCWRRLRSMLRVPWSGGNARATVDPLEPALSGFVFKIQANMDPAHRDRIAFLASVLRKVHARDAAFSRAAREEVRVADALTFMASDRAAAEEAYAGDIIGLHNHGTINIGDTFTEASASASPGCPTSPLSCFVRAVLKDPLKMKALQKGLSQLCEEGATQLFKPLRNNDLILGAVGQLQFEVVAFRLQDEYGVQCVFDTVNVHTARWIGGGDEQKIEEFRVKAYDNLAVDHSGALVYLATGRVNLELTLERWPDIVFRETRELAA